MTYNLGMHYCSILSIYNSLNLLETVQYIFNSHFNCQETVKVLRYSGDPINFPINKRIFLQSQSLIE